MIDQQLMLPIGTVLHSDTYRVVRFIASGGFGNTYEVEHVKLGKHYCLKEFFMRNINLRRGTTVTVSVEGNRSTFEQMRTKFFKEAQRMARIENPHVVEVTDCFEENQTAYYVMKLIDGQSLSSKMAAQGRPFIEAEVRTMLPQVLSALRCVHEQGIYHLDLKPANIMTNADGHLWLIDFGASKQLSAAESQTLSTSTGLCYTPNYAPSELVGGNTKRIGPWTDFYSLGATLYNLLSSHQPPEADDVRYDGERAFQFPASVSADMRSLILWLMSPDIPQRPQTVEEIEQRLATFAEIPEESIEPETPLTEETVRADEGTETVKADTGTETEIADEGTETVKVDEGTETVKAETSKRSKARVNAAFIIGIIILYILGFALLRKMGKNEDPVYSVSYPVEDKTPAPPSALPPADTPTVSLSDYCPDSNHPHAIDLGLPSGTKWACCNVGAGKPADYGDYYAWGEVETKSNYYWDSYLFGDSESNVQSIGNNIAGTKYDVAHAQWGGSWRMPSEKQIQELLDNTNSAWITWNPVDEVQGRTFTSKTNGNVVFFPAAGDWRDERLYKADMEGAYWSSTVCAGRPYSAFALEFGYGGVNETMGGRYSSSYGRFYGLSVRPVR